MRDAQQPGMGDVPAAIQQLEFSPRQRKSKLLGKLTKRVE
jgi:hypothetical protein